MPIKKQAPQADIDKFLPIRHTLLLNLALQSSIEFNGNTFWEELTCVGYNPQTSNLEAVVGIKLPTGYSGGLCSPGSKEYVRFFVDYGTGFEDLGFTSFDVHDIPDAPGVVHPIEYVVPMPLPDSGHRRCCGTAVIPKVRAVLSWNTPPSTDPNVLNAFGNRLDAHIQLAPKVFSLQCLIESGILKPVPGLLEQFDLEKPLAKTSSIVAHDLVAQARAYQQAQVDHHRFLTPVLKPLIGLETASSLPTASLKEIASLGIDLAAVLAAIEKTSADESYEQLTCAGLQTGFDTVGAVLQVKRPLGYSGDLCHNGSTEYVAFWADWDNAGTFEYLGTANVQVHDLGAAIPADGVRYSVSLLSPKFVQHLKACTQPNVIRLRAVLSWSTPPSTTDPNAFNTWGNRLDVNIQIRPGQAVSGTDLTDLIYRVGGVALTDISLGTHLAFPSTFIAGACGASRMDRPWGGQVTIQGRIYNTGLPGSVRFRVRYKKHADPDTEANWTPVTFSQDFVLEHPLLMPPDEPVHQVAGVEPGLGGGWFDYIENPLAAPPIFERDNLLADWETGSLEGVYDLRLEYRRTTDAPGFYHRSLVVTITLHNYQMVASTTATPVIDFSKDVDLIVDGLDCKSYTKGTTFTGKLRAVDPYFYGWSLDLQPSTHTHGAAASPSCRTYTSLADGGDGSLAWSLNTAPLDKCGYTLTLEVSDRTIIDSNGAIVHSASKAVGFAVV